MNFTLVKRKSVLIIGMIAALLIIGLGVGKYLTSPSNLIGLDVNPSIEIHTNRLNQVVSINPVNEDAKLLMAGYQLEDKNLESVIKNIVDRMILSGYIASGQENKILVTVDDTNTTENLLTNVNNTIAAYLQEKQVSADVLEQSLSISVEDTVTAHNNDVSAGKMAIINRLQDNNISFTTEELAHSSIKDLIILALDNNIAMEDLIQNYSIVSGDQQNLGDGKIESMSIVDAVSSATVAVTPKATPKATPTPKVTPIPKITHTLAVTNAEDTDNEDGDSRDNEDSQNYEDNQGDEDSQNYEDNQGDEDSQDNEDSQNYEDNQGDEDGQGNEDSQSFEDNKGGEDNQDHEDNWGYRNYSNNEDDNND